MSELDDRVARAVRSAYHATPPLDPEARERLMEAVRQSPPPRAGWLDRLPRLRAITLRPLAAGVAGVLVLAAGVVIGWGLRDRNARTEVATGSPVAGGHEVIEFVLAAPGASSVSLVGDFNGWDTEATPMRRSGTGDRWTIAIPLSAGRHVYAFVVDGRRWLPDPVAPLAPEDGFGTRNSVVVVGEGST